MARKPAKKAAVKTKRKAGAPTKYTLECIARLKKAFVLGGTVKMACGYACISEETYSQWLKSKPEFSERVKEWKGYAGVEWLAKIEAAAALGSWQAAAWKLERRWPADYGRKVDPVGITQNVLILHSHSREELGLDDQADAPVEIKGLRLHMGD